jgi:hypothetical protein
MKIVITNTTPHNIIVDGVCKGSVYLCRAESKKLRYWAISCVPGKGWDTYSEACDYARNDVEYENV